MWLVREQEKEEELRKHREAQGYNGDIQDEDEFKISFWLRLKHNRILQALIIIILVAVITPVCLLLFLDMSAMEYDEEHTCVVRSDYQIPCGYSDINRKECKAILCCYDDFNKYCYHTLPSYYHYTSNQGENNYKPKTDDTPFGGTNTPEVYLTVEQVSKEKVSIILSKDKKQVKQNTNQTIEPEYDLNVYKNDMTIEIKRRNSTEKILTTSYGPTIVSNRYWEWNVDLQAEVLYGMDFFVSNTNKTVTKLVYKNADSHSSLPKFMAFSQGKYHGLIVDHEGPLEVTILPSKLLVFRLLSGRYLTLHLSTGPEPVHLLSQQRNSEPKIPPLWTLGVHICRDGLLESVDDALSEFSQFLREVSSSSYNFPYESDCIHENLFSFIRILSDTEKQQIKDAVDVLRTKNKRFMMSLAPQIYVNHPVSDSARDKNILYNSAGGIFIGKYQDTNVTYPDFSLTQTKEWFKDSFSSLMAGIDADAFVLKDNWPLNENYTMKGKEKFQYITEDIFKVLSNTIPWDSISNDSVEHISKHNSYGQAFVDTVQQLNAKENRIILSSSYNGDQNTIAHVQNVNISWVNLKEMLTKTLSHSLFGGLLFSVPVCGTTSYYTEELNLEVCMRWYLTAATMPLFRISSDIPRRYPTNITSGYFRNTAIDAIKFRYKLIPYFYTILSEKLPIVRPMFFDFWTDNITLNLDEQYMLGDGLLVVQPLLLSIQNIHVYLPKNPGNWFEFWGGMKFNETGWNTIPIVDTDLVIFIAAGKIIPLQNEISDNAELSRKKPLKFAVALDCSTGQKCKASGSIRVSDSYSWKFNANENSLEVLDYQPTIHDANYLTNTYAQVYGIRGHEDKTKLYECKFVKLDTDKPYCNYTEIP